jgi:Arc/MetJ family transcription regulator
MTQSLVCILIHMRTNIVLDDTLVEKAFRYSASKTKKALVHEALSEFVRQRQQHNLLDLAGKIRLAPGYDHKKARR